MHFRKIRLYLTFFIVLFSLNGFSQTDQSAHPLLDKYYPQPKKDTTKEIVKENIQPPAPKPEVFPAAPTAKQGPIVSPPVSKTIATQEITTPTVTTTATPPSITSSQNGNTTPIATVTSLEKPKPVITSDTSAVINQTPIVTAKSPVKEAVQPRSPAPPPYMDTRLGSSTRQYDTYEKNNNGAGSVTTSPK